MANYLDVCRFTPTLGGTTDWTYSSAVTGYQSPTLAAALNGVLYKYRAESADLSQWEVGEGAYNSGTNVFARTTVLYNSSGTTSKISFSAVPQVAIVALKEDIFLNTAQNSIINGKIVESHAASAATFAIKTLAGNDPTSADPVCAIFGDGSSLSITAALSVTIPSTGTMGATNGVAFRLWFALINDSGTARIGVRNCTNATGTAGFPGDGLIVSTIITAPNSAQVTYTNVAVTLPQFIIVGFADYESGLAAVGTWGVSPTRMHMFGPHIKKPGDTLQELYFANSANTTTTSSTLQSTGLTGSITPNSICNPITVDVRGSVYTSNAAVSGVTARITRGGTAMGTSMVGGGGASGAQNTPSTTAVLFDRPASTSPVTYLVKVNNGDNVTSVEWNHNSAETDMVLYELMG